MRNSANPLGIPRRLRITGDALKQLAVSIIRYSLVFCVGCARSKLSANAAARGAFGVILQQQFGHPPIQARQRGELSWPLTSQSSSPAPPASRINSRKF